MKKIVNLIIILSLCISHISACVAKTHTTQDTSYDSNECDAIELLENNSDVLLTKLKSEAIEQYEQEDYTPLSEPAIFNILWLGFRNVTYKNLVFHMTPFDEEYLKSVVLNFEQSVERITNNNLDIKIDLYFVDDSIELVKSDFLYLSQSDVQDYINPLMEVKAYHSVITTVQTAGKENQSRNAHLPEYESEYVILGLMTGDCLESRLGYSTFDLGLPFDGTYPLNDPEIPSLYATAVAVHEWMHQFESIGNILNIEYPNTHAYMGPDKFPEYKKFEADLYNYDYFEFYELVLQGKLPYDDGKNIRHVGMYPKMWEFLTKYNNQSSVLNVTISTKDGKYYLTGEPSSGKLKITEKPYVWSIQKDIDGYYIIYSKDNPEYRFDLNNDYDSAGNTVGIHPYTGYINAQRWDFKKNNNDTYSIQTGYKSGLFITADLTEDQMVIKPLSDKDSYQQWILTVQDLQNEH